MTPVDDEAEFPQTPVHVAAIKGEATDAVGLYSLTRCQSDVNHHRDKLKGTPGAPVMRCFGRAAREGTKLMADGPIIEAVAVMIWLTTGGAIASA